MPGYQSYNDAAKKIIEENKYMALSTCDLDKNPWGSTVFYAYDKSFDFYFMSAIDSRHAENININPKVAFVIFDSSQPMGRAESIQAEGKAVLVSAAAELKEVIRIYGARQFPRAKIDPLRRYPPEEFSEAAELRFYRIRLANVYISGTLNRRTEIDTARM